MLFTISGGRESFSQKDRFRICFFFFFGNIYFFLKKKKKDPIIIAHLCIFNFFLFFLVVSFFVYVFFCFLFFVCLWSPPNIFSSLICALYYSYVSPFIYIYISLLLLPTLLCVLCFMFSFGRYCVLALLSFLYDDVLGSVIYIYSLPIIFLHYLLFSLASL